MRAWLVLTFLNFVDLWLYVVAMSRPDVNEVWLMKSVPFETLVVVKLMMPVFVIAVLLLYRTPKIVKTIWWLCGLYAVVQVWNVLQLVL